MAIVVEERQSNYAPTSNMDEGIQQVTVTKVEDLGMVPTPAQFLAANQQQAKKDGRDPASVPTEQRKVRLTFANAAGQEITRDYTAIFGSASKRSNLFKDLTRIMGEEPKGSIDLESVVGKKATLMIEQAIGQRSGKPYSKIVSLTAAPKAKPVASAAGKITDEDIPF